MDFIQDLEELIQLISTLWGRLIEQLAGIVSKYELEEGVVVAGCVDDCVERRGNGHKLHHCSGITALGQRKSCVATWIRLILGCALSIYAICLFFEEDVIIRKAFLKKSKYAP